MSGSRPQTTTRARSTRRPRRLAKARPAGVVRRGVVFRSRRGLHARLPQSRSNSSRRAARCPILQFFASGSEPLNSWSPGSYHSQDTQPPIPLSATAGSATCERCPEPSSGLEPETPSLPWPWKPRISGVFRLVRCSQVRSSALIFAEFGTRFGTRIAAAY